MSEFEHNKLALGDQGETFYRFANHLGIKLTTLRNYRDAFDPYTNATRRGWWQKALSPKMKTVFGMLKGVDEPTLRGIVLGFLH